MVCTSIREQRCVVNSESWDFQPDSSNSLSYLCGIVLCVCVCEAVYSLTKRARIYDEWLACIVTGLHLLKCCDLCVPVAFCHYKQNQLVGLDSVNTE